MTKTRVDISLARRLISTLKFISDADLNDAVKTLIENEDLLYPIYFNVLSAIRAEYSRLNADTKNAVSEYVINLINNDAATMSVDLNLQYAVRLIAEHHTEEAISTLSSLYDGTNSDAIRRDIILVMAKWKNWIWLSDRRAYFRSMVPMQRRAFIIASYVLKDEGKHWRDHTKDEFSPFETITRDWIAGRINQAGWEVPL